jgi:hypothetical protein
MSGRDSWKPPADAPEVRTWHAEDRDTAFVPAGPCTGPSPRCLSRLRWPLAFLTLLVAGALGTQIEVGDAGAVDVPWVTGLVMVLAALAVAAWVGGASSEPARSFRD